MVLKLILITIVLVAIVAFFLSLSIIFRRNGKFPNFHVGGNKQHYQTREFIAPTHRTSLLVSTNVQSGDIAG